MFEKLANPAKVMALILSIMACALPAQSGAQDSESLDAIERRLLEHYIWSWLTGDHRRTTGMDIASRARSRVCRC
jgi:hypothetical protein